MSKLYGTLFLLISIGLVSKAAAYVFYRKQNRKTQEINDVILFSNEANNLKRSKYSRCIITASMERLLYYLSTPKYTLDICMYVFTNTDLSNAVLKLHFKGIKVRLIIDADMAYSTGSCLKRFEKHGIPVRWMKSTNLMHHKFCLLDTSTEAEDRKPLLITGSLNWTNQALSGNWENVIVTTQRDLVEQYRIEYEHMWGMFKPIVKMQYS